MKKLFLFILTMTTVSFFCINCPSPGDGGGSGGVVGSGALTYGGSYSDENIEGAYSVAVSPDGNHVYVAAYNADAVAWFTINPDGSLTYGGCYSDANIDHAFAVTVSPDGNHIYVAAGIANAVAWFSRDK
jgi:6-phosphogluconolactonase (cycloisomerase 2 family)